MCLCHNKLAIIYQTYLKVQFERGNKISNLPKNKSPINRNLIPKFSPNPRRMFLKVGYIKKYGCKKKNRMLIIHPFNNNLALRVWKEAV